MRAPIEPPPELGAGDRALVGIGAARVEVVHRSTEGDGEHGLDLPPVDVHAVDRVDAGPCVAGQREPPLARVDAVVELVPRGVVDREDVPVEVAVGDALDALGPGWIDAEVVGVHREVQDHRVLGERGDPRIGHDGAGWVEALGRVDQQVGRLRAGTTDSPRAG